MLNESILSIVLRIVITALGLIEAHVEASKKV